VDINELTVEIEEALDRCHCVEHAASNALGQLRFRTRDGRIYEIDLAMLPEFAKWTDTTPVEE
jgi:hypothetical protein